MTPEVVSILLVVLIVFGWVAALNVDTQERIGRCLSIMWRRCTGKSPRLPK